MVIQDLLKFKRDLMRLKQHGQVLAKYCSHSWKFATFDDFISWIRPWPHGPMAPRRIAGHCVDHARILEHAESLWAPWTSWSGSCPHFCRVVLVRLGKWKRRAASHCSGYDSNDMRMVYQVYQTYPSIFLPKACRDLSPTDMQMNISISGYGSRPNTPKWENMRNNYSRSGQYHNSSRLHMFI